MVWSLEQVPDMSGKTILITGATSGIGLETAKFFCQRGAKLILACRNEEKMAAVTETFLSETPTAEIIQLKVDVSDLDSVKAFAQSLEDADCGPLDVVLLNAGVMLTDWAVSKQGFESTFATNHLGHWLLVGLIMCHIKPACTSRIISVSSIGHRITNCMNYDHAQGNRSPKFHPFTSYTESKLANLLFVAELNRRLQAANSPIIAAAVHPGATETDLGRDIKLLSPLGVLKTIGSLVWQSTYEGALPLIFACSDEDITRSSYYGPRDLWGMRGLPISNAYKSEAALDDAKAAELWTFSEKICDFSYDT